MVKKLLTLLLITMLALSGCTYIDNSTNYNTDTDSGYSNDYSVSTTHYTPYYDNQHVYHTHKHCTTSTTSYRTRKGRSYSTSTHCYYY